MVQGVSKNLKRKASNQKNKKPKQGPKGHSKPQALKKGGVDQKLTSAIGRNIEQLMAARLIHSGQRLKVVERPKNVDALLSQKGAAKSKKAAFDLIKTEHNQKKRRKNEVLEELKKEEEAKKEAEKENE